MVLCAKSQTYCVPQTQSYCCNYGITSVTLPNVSQTSSDASAGYEDFSAQLSSAIEGSLFNIQIQTGGIEPHDVRVWLDANNDGTFDHSTEMVFESLNAQNSSGILNIPSEVLMNINLRLRITADFAGSTPLPCNNPIFGQTEDYSLKIISAGAMPVVDFIASSTNSCNGNILFTEQSTGNPSSYLWDFGDGHTSTESVHGHTYSQSGIYSVTLIASNSQGSDTLTKTDYITVSLSETCDTFSVPAQGSYSVLYSCDYVLTDNGIGSNYSDNTDGIISLSTLWAEKVCLNFSEFHYEEEFDYIEIYDGASPAAPLIGKYSGTDLPPEICSTGPALCIKQHTDDVVNYSGFVAQANCILNNEEVIPSFFASVYPNPFIDQLTISLPNNNYNNWVISCRSITGQLVLQKSFTNEQSTVLSLENITAGIYVIEIHSPAGSWQQKIIKLP